MFGEEYGFGGFGKLVLFVGFALSLEALELSGIAFAAAREAMFLELEVAQFLFVLAADFEEEVGLPIGVVPESGVGLNDGGGATGDDGEFEEGRGGEAPAGIDDGLDERIFLGADWLVEVLIIEAVLVVTLGVGGVGEKDGGAGEAVFDGVETDFRFTFVGAGASGFLSVFAIGGETGFGYGLGL